MSRLDLAKKRFEAALKLLEAALSDRLAAQDAAEDGVELAALIAERDALRARLDAVEEDSRSLAGLTEEVEIRLEDTIAELRSALGR